MHRNNGAAPWVLILNLQICGTQTSTWFGTDMDRLPRAAMTLSMCGWLAAQWTHALFYLFPILPASERRRLFCAEQKSIEKLPFSPFSASFVFFQHLSTFNCLLMFADVCCFLHFSVRKDGTDLKEKVKARGWRTMEDTPPGQAAKFADVACELSWDPI